MGQHADQLILDIHHYTVENIMEVLLDIALTILGTLGQGHQPGKALGRLHTPKEMSLRPLYLPSVFWPYVVRRKSSF